MAVQNNKKKVETCISTLKDLQSEFEKMAKPRVQYKRIRWALTCAIEAVEKQFMPKKIEEWNGQASCPHCKRLFGPINIIKKLISWDMYYCKWCGQKLDWSEWIETKRND